MSRKQGARARRRDETRARIDAQLQALYDQIPDIPDCKGLCWISCGPVEMSDREADRIRDAGVSITPHEAARWAGPGYFCDALTGDGKCSVYDLRPVQCRTWGAAEAKPCPFGCSPETPLTDDELFRIVTESVLAGGSRNLGRTPAEIEELLADWQADRGDFRRRWKERSLANQLKVMGRFQRLGGTLPAHVAARPKLSEEGRSDA